MPGSTSLVDRILAELSPILARQRQSMVRHGCLRAVSSGNLHLLMLLDNEGPLPMSRLAEQLDASLPNVTGIVGRMEQRDLVERVRGSIDRRLVIVRITDAGRTAMHEVELVKLQLFQRLFEAMSPSDQSVCLKAFTALGETAARLDAVGGLDDLEHDHRHDDHTHAHPHVGRPIASRATADAIPTTLV